MHICPQEIMAIVGAVDILRPALIIARAWCEACYTGAHKSCEDHKKAVEELETIENGGTVPTV